MLPEKTGGRRPSENEAGDEDDEQQQRNPASFWSIETNLEWRIEDIFKTCERTKYIIQ